MPTFTDDREIEEIRSLLLSWFAAHQRPLPWRSTYVPYQVWIAEIMGQQTQMERVAEYFRRWMERFPTLASVAEAPELAVLKAWEGLGYYSRARNVQRTARLLIADGHSEIPDDYHRLLELPGIGPYTAAAICSIAFNQPYPLIDANVERLFARLADIPTALKQAGTKKRLAKIAELLLERSHPRQFNQALMELGALICTPKQPACTLCPLRSHCRALSADTVEFRPLPSAKQKKIEILMACGILRRQGRYFIQQRLPDDIWGGLWEFPGGRIEPGESPEQAATREIEEETGWQVSGLRPFTTVTHYYTRYRVVLHAFLGEIAEQAGEPSLTAAVQGAWVSPAELAGYPYPAGHRQLVAALTQPTFSGI